MAKGTIAKDNVIKKLQEAFGNDFLGVLDKKIYVRAKDGEEMSQIAISLTCPKEELAVNTASAVEDANAVDANKITSAEEANVKQLLASLGL